MRIPYHYVFPTATNRHSKLAVKSKQTMQKQCTINQKEDLRLCLRAYIALAVSRLQVYLGRVKIYHFKVKYPVIKDYQLPPSCSFVKQNPNLLLMLHKVDANTSKSKKVTEDLTKHFVTTLTRIH